MAIDTVGFDILAFRTTAFDFPQANRDFDFGAELGIRSMTGARGCSLFLLR